MGSKTDENIGRVFSLVETNAAQVSEQLEKLAREIASKDSVSEAEQILIKLIGAIDEQAQIMLASQKEISTQLQRVQAANQSAIETLRDEVAKLGKDSGKTQDILLRVLGVLQSPKKLVFDDKDNPVGVVPEFNL